jgi:hypothetical protein
MSACIKLITDRNKKAENPGQLGSRGSPLGGSMAGGPAQLMSHHMSNLVHASDDECLSLVALLAFERAAFDALSA